VTFWRWGTAVWECLKLVSGYNRFLRPVNSGWCILNLGMSNRLGRASIVQNGEEALKSEHKSALHVFEICTSTVMFVIMLLLVSNVSVLAIASHYNDLACQIALRTAGNAVVDGRDTYGVMEAARLCLQGAPRSFFITRPEFIEFKDAKKPTGGRIVRIGTRSMARIPAPFLIPNAPINSDGQMSFSRTYQIDIALANIPKAKKLK
jgi:hypothetical protein